MKKVALIISVLVKLTYGLYNLVIYLAFILRSMIFFNYYSGTFNII